MNHRDRILQELGDLKATYTEITETELHYPIRAGGLLMTVEDYLQELSCERPHSQTSKVYDDNDEVIVEEIVERYGSKPDTIIHFTGITNYVADHISVEEIHNLLLQFRDHPAKRMLFENKLDEILFSVEETTNSMMDYAKYYENIFIHNNVIQNPRSQVNNILHLTSTQHFTNKQPSFYTQNIKKINEQIDLYKKHANGYKTNVARVKVNKAGPVILEDNIVGLVDNNTTYGIAYMASVHNPYPSTTTNDSWLNNPLESARKLTVNKLVHGPNLAEKVSSKDYLLGVLFFK